MGDSTGIPTLPVLSEGLPAAGVAGSAGEVSSDGQKLDSRVQVKGEEREARTSDLVDGAPVLITNIDACTGVVHVTYKEIL